MHPSRRHHFLALSFLTVVLSWAAMAETKSVLLLHTNDIHDHVRPGYNQTGGLPYLSGYINQIRQSRKDVLLLDGGDVTEKGDMVAFADESRITYEAMGTMHYDAVTIGNHDFSHGLPVLKEKQALLGEKTSVICLNVLDDGGKPIFPASVIKEVNGLRVGIIGVTTETDDAHVTEFSETCKNIAAEAERLDKECQLIVVLAHLGKKSCLEIAKSAPAVDLFVGGHTHELLRQPVVSPDSGALIVQAGEYAGYAGWLEVAVDTDTEKVSLVKGEVIPMDHQNVPCDEALRRMIQEKETTLCPNAAKVLGNNKSEISKIQMAKIAAAAFLKASGADLAFCHAGQVMRDVLPAGEIDVNAVFRTGGQRGDKIVEVELSGKDITDYWDRLSGDRKGMTACAGADIPARPGKEGYAGILPPDKKYRVVLPEVEWTARLQKQGSQNLKSINATPCPFSFVDAVSPYIAEFLNK